MRTPHSVRIQKFLSNATTDLPAAYKQLVFSPTVLQFLPSVWRIFLNSRTSSQQKIQATSAKIFQINCPSVEYFVLVTIKKTNIKLALIADSFGVLIFWNRYSCVLRTRFQLAHNHSTFFRQCYIFLCGGSQWCLTLYSLQATVFCRIRQDTALKVRRKLFFLPFICTLQNCENRLLY
jgi:hypothetical protein